MSIPQLEMYTAEVYGDQWTTMCPVQTFYILLRGSWEQKGFLKVPLADRGLDRASLVLRGDSGTVTEPRSTSSRGVLVSRLRRLIWSAVGSNGGGERDRSVQSHNNQPQRRRGSGRAGARLVLSGGGERERTRTH